MYLSVSRSLSLCVVSCITGYRREIHQDYNTHHHPAWSWYPASWYSPVRCYITAKCSHHTWWSRRSIRKPVRSIWTFRKSVSKPDRLEAKPPRSQEASPHRSQPAKKPRSQPVGQPATQPVKTPASQSPEPESLPTLQPVNQRYNQSASVTFSQRDFLPDLAVNWLLSAVYITTLIISSHLPHITCTSQLVVIGNWYWYFPEKSPLSLMTP